MGGTALADPRLPRPAAWSENPVMRSRHLHAIVASVLALAAARAVADDPAQQAHVIMREALLERALRLPAAITAGGAAQSATTTAREHMDRTRGAEAERAAHQRAAEHGRCGPAQGVPVAKCAGRTRACTAAARTAPGEWTVRGPPTTGE